MRHDYKNEYDIEFDCKITIEIAPSIFSPSMLNEINLIKHIVKYIEKRTTHLSKFIFEIISLSKLIAKNDEYVSSLGLGFRHSLIGLFHFIVNYNTKR